MGVGGPTVTTKDGNFFVWHDSYPFSKINFKEFSRTRIDFFRTPNFTLNLSFPSFQKQFSLWSTYISYNENSGKSVSLELSRFPGLSRTCSLKSENTIPGFYRFSRNRVNLDIIITWAMARDLFTYLQGAVHKQSWLTYKTAKIQG